MCWTLSPRPTSARPASPRWPEWLRAKRWIVDHVNHRRRYEPPKGQELQKELRHERKALTGRLYQPPSGRAEIGGYLCNKVHKLPSDRCWWCGRNEKQTLHYLFMDCAPDPRDVERRGHPYPLMVKARF